MTNTSVEALEAQARELFRQRIHPDQVDRDPTAEPTAPVEKQARAEGTISSADMDAAKSVLAEVGGGDNIVVYPEKVSLGVGNHALTLKSQQQIDLYHVGADATHYDESVGFSKDLIGMDTILVHPSVLRGSAVSQRGQIWHEHGHVLHGPSENGDVFAYELKCLRTKLSKTDAKTFVDDERKGGVYYNDTAVNPGLDSLAEELGVLGFVFKAGAKAEAQARRAAPDLVVGKVLRGTPESVTKAVGTDETLPDLVALGVGKDFEWAGCRWRMLRHDVEFKITVTESGNVSWNVNKSLAGTWEQIKRMAKTLKAPPAFDQMQVGSTFVWDAATWKLVSSKEALHLEVVARLD